MMLVCLLFKSSLLSCSCCLVLLVSVNVLLVLLVLLFYRHCAEEVNAANGWQVPGEMGLGAVAVLALCLAGLSGPHCIVCCSTP